MKTQRRRRTVVGPMTIKVPMQRRIVVGPMTIKVPMRRRKEERERQ